VPRHDAVAEFVPLDEASAPLGLGEVDERGLGSEEIRAQKLLQRRRLGDGEFLG